MALDYKIQEPWLVNYTWTYVNTYTYNKGLQARRCIQVNHLRINLPPSTVMTYSTHHTNKSELKSLHAKVDEQADQMHYLTLDLNSIKQELEISKQELNSTRHALKDITNDWLSLKNNIIILHRSIKM